MKVLAANIVMCDHVEEGSKKNLLGISGAVRPGAEGYPTLVHGQSLYARVALAEPHSRFPFRLELEHPDATRVLIVAGWVDVTVVDGIHLPNPEFVIPLPSLSFPMPGSYRLVLSIDERSAATTLLQALSDEMIGRIGLVQMSACTTARALLSPCRCCHTKRRQTGLVRRRRAESPMMRVAFVATLALSCACGSQPPSRAVPVSNATADDLGASTSRPSTLERECWLGADRCAIELDLDGDGRADRAETVREAPCNPATQANEEPDDDGVPDPSCNQGFWIMLATGATQRVGAGVELVALPSSDSSIEPMSLEADLGGLQLLAISHKDRPGRIRLWKSMTCPAPCVGDGLVLTGTDAAAVLCWVGDTAAAYHLGF